MADEYFYAIRNMIIRRAVKIVIVTTALTLLCYLHDMLPKSLSTATAIFTTPVEIASGISRYFNPEIRVNQSLGTIILANLIAAIAIVFVAEWCSSMWRRIRKEKG